MLQVFWLHGRPVDVVSNRGNASASSSTLRWWSCVCSLVPDLLPWMWKRTAVPDRLGGLRSLGLSSPTMSLCVLSSCCLPRTSLHCLLPGKLTCLLSLTMTISLLTGHCRLRLCSTHSAGPHSSDATLGTPSACSRLTTLAPAETKQTVNCRLHGTLLPSIKLCLSI